MISIITFLYTFHSLPLEFVPFAPFCQYSFQTKNIDTEIFKKITSLFFYT